MNHKPIALLLILALFLGCLSVKDNKPAPAPQPVQETPEQKAIAQATQVTPESMQSIGGVDVSDDLDQGLQELDEVSQ